MTGASPPSSPTAPRVPSTGDKAIIHADSLEHAITQLQIHLVRGISGMRTSRSLLGIMPDIAPRPVLLVAGGGFPAEIPASRRYRDAGGPNVQLWELPDAAHTAGCASTRPNTSGGPFASSTRRRAYRGYAPCRT